MSDTTTPHTEPQRRISQRRIAAGEARTAVFRRVYDAPIDDVWAACTEPDRLARWFMPVTGELRIGGAFDLGGFLSCEVLRCEPPSLLAISQVYEDFPADEIELRLSPGENDQTVFELEHATVLGEVTFGGRLLDAISNTGGGWEPGLFALELFLRDELPDGFDMGAFRQQPEIAAIAANAQAEWGALVASYRGANDPDV